ncbi:Uncharacterised protein [Mycobacteroides abscessus subsp. abscessus]|nr:Uncharacterised protein [Mycobacteroides abscessus subsp. abscessus]
MRTCCTQALTEPTVVVGAAVPKPTTTMLRHTRPMSRFMHGPPSMMMMRLPMGRRWNCRSSSPGWRFSASTARASAAIRRSIPRGPDGVSASASALVSAPAGGYIPIMEMYPPRGMALMPYSVSPRRRENRVLPKPIMYCVTRTPKSLAGTRCPISCRAMEAAMPSTISTTPRRNSGQESLNSVERSMASQSRRADGARRSPPPRSAGGRATGPVASGLRPVRRGTA